MRFIVYLLTLFFVGTAVAQNPTILAGNYITNVFGQSNFIKNPNAQSNVLNITLSGGGSPTASVSRSTTTPLVATTEFLVGISSANGTITWDTRAFDSGMKNQNCEARFSYRGFQSTSKAHIKQGANTVATLNLSATGTDPRIASINFPCGDLSAATTFVITDTSTLGGVNEIGGIYVGLATNQANVAQATKVGGWDNILCSGEASLTTGSAGVWLAPNLAGTCSGTAVGLASASLSNLNTLQFTFTNLPPGEYMLLMPAYVYPNTATTVRDRCDGRIRETTLNLTDGQNAFASSDTTNWFSIGQINQFKFTNSVTANRSFQIEFKRAATSSNCAGGIINQGQNLSLYRFPLSSELVVTPERQNVFAAARWHTSVNASFHSGGTAPTGYATMADATFASNVTRFGKAAAPLSSGCLGGVSCSANDFGFSVPNLPVGSYSLQVVGLLNSAAGTNATECSFQILEAVSGTSVAKQSYVDNLISGNGTRTFNSTYAGIYNNPSVATRNFIVRAEKVSGSTTGICQANASSTRDIYMELIPLDQPSNSALYVQGPVKASETGDAIPTGYQNEWSTRSISDTSMRSQSSPTVNTKYYPWTGELTLPTGNWQICYRIMTQLDQNSSSTTVGRITAGIENKTDSTELFSQDVFATKGSTVTTLAGNLSSCENVAISSSKIFRVFIKYQNDAGTPTVNTIYLRNDLNTGKLWATRLN